MNRGNVGDHLVWNAVHYLQLHTLRDDCSQKAIASPGVRVWRRRAGQVNPSVFYTFCNEYFYAPSRFKQSRLRDHLSLNPNLLLRESAKSDKRLWLYPADRERRFAGGPVSHAFLAFYCVRKLIACNTSHSIFLFSILGLDYFLLRLWRGT